MHKAIGEIASIAHALRLSTETRRRTRTSERRRTKGLHGRAAACMPWSAEVHHPVWDKRLALKLKS